VPPGVVTLIFPVVAPLGTVALICDPDVTLNDTAAVPLNATRVAPVKLEPLIVTRVPMLPWFGEKELIVGAGAGGAVTVKLAELVAVPPGVVTEIGPLAAPDGTVALICVSELTANDAAAPLNDTVVAPVNAVPVIVTDVPGEPLLGANDVIVGATAGAPHEGKVNDPMRVCQLS
jgi:hypothetical protein